MTKLPKKVLMTTARFHLQKVDELERQFALRKAAWDKRLSEVEKGKQDELSRLRNQIEGHKNQANELNQSRLEQTQPSLKS